MMFCYSCCCCCFPPFVVFIIVVVCFPCLSIIISRYIFSSFLTFPVSGFSRHQSLFPSCRIFHFCNFHLSFSHSSFNLPFPLTVAIVYFIHSPLSNSLPLLFLSSLLFLSYLSLTLRTPFVIRFPFSSFPVVSFSSLFPLLLAVSPSSYSLRYFGLPLTSLPFIFTSFPCTVYLLPLVIIRSFSSFSPFLFALSPLLLFSPFPYTLYRFVNLLYKPVLPYLR